MGRSWRRAQNPAWPFPQPPRIRTPEDPEPGGVRPLRLFSFPGRERRCECSRSTSPSPDVEELRRARHRGTGEGFLDLRRDRRGVGEEVDLTKEQVEDFYTYLIDHGVELVEGVEHKTPPHEQPALAEDSKAAAPLDLTVEPSLDSLQLYLREIGKVPLLTADQEVRLAKRIERGDMSAKTQMMRPISASSSRSRRAISAANPSSISSRKARSASSARSSSTRDSSSRRTRPGGSARP